MRRKAQEAYTSVPLIQSNRRGILAAASVAVLGAFACLVVYYVVSQREQKLMEAEFKRLAAEKTSAIQRELDTAEALIESVAALYMASDFVSAEEFKIFTRPLLEHDPSIRAISHIPIVLDTERGAFEQAMHDSGASHFRITEKNLAGKLVPANKRHEYTPVQRIEPLEGNEPALGYDVASEVVRRAAVTRSISEKIPSATGPIQLVQEQKSEYGMLILAPVFKMGKSDQPVQSLASGVFNIKDLADKILRQAIPRGVLFDLIEKGPQNEDICIYRNMPDGKRQGPYQRAKLHMDSDVQVAGRRWKVHACSTPAFEENFSSPTPWNVVFCGLFFTAVVSIHLLRLNQLNNQLANSEAKFKLLAENSHSVFWIMSPDAGTVYYLSPGYKRLFGMDPEEVYKKPELFMEAIDPEDRDKVSRSIRGLSYGLDFHEEWRIHSPDGETRWIFNHGFPIISEEGYVNQIVGIASDITQQKKSHNGLHKGDTAHPGPGTHPTG